VAFSPDSQKLASSGGSSYPEPPSEVIVRNVATAVRLWKNKVPRAVVSLAFRPDGAQLAAYVTGSGGLHLWDAETGASQSLPFKTARPWETDVAYSLDGKQLILANHNEIQVLDSNTGAPRTVCHSQTKQAPLALHPDGKHLASGSDDSFIKLWNLETGAEVGTIRGHRNFIRYLRYFPNGKRLLSVSLDGDVKIWDLANSFAGWRRLPYRWWVGGVACSPDNRWLATVGAGHMQLWDRQTRQKVRELQGPAPQVSSVAFSSDSRLVAVGGGDGRMRLWQVSTGTELQTIDAHPKAVSGLAFSPTGGLLASGGEDGAVRLWAVSRDRIAPQPLHTLRGHKFTVNGLTFSRDGKYVVSGDTCGVRGAGTLRVWEVASGRQCRSLSGVDVRDLAISSDGHRLAVAAGEDEIRVWKAKRDGVWDLDAPPRLHLRGHLNGVQALAFSPDGQRIASTDHGQALSLWDANTGEQILTLEIPDGYRSQLAFTPDGKALIVRTAGGVRVYEPPR
jgi:WD40 repeat protein